MQKNIRGFTLIELVVALAIVVIIVSVTITLYTTYMRKGRRADAINSLISISLAEERYRSNNSQYGTLAQVWNSVTSSSEGYYTLSITNVSATRYTVTATAQGTQANDATTDGTSCSTLTLDMNSGTVTKTPAACWPK